MLFRYLERILDQNPSNHPTVVLSQIQHNELKHLVEFMYSGEVAVEQESLPKLLEAANVLQIKGLYEAPAEEDSPSNDDNSSNNKNKPEIQERYAQSELTFRLKVFGTKSKTEISNSLSVFNLVQKNFLSESQ